MDEMGVQGDAFLQIGAIFFNFSATRGINSKLFDRKWSLDSIDMIQCPLVGKVSIEACSRLRIDEIGVQGDAFLQIQTEKRWFLRNQRYKLETFQLKMIIR